jgi:hypothetical protein
LTETNAIKESVILKSSETIIFGEKQTERMDFFMDYMEGTSGNDAEAVEYGCHSRPNRNTKGAGSNFGFGDSSVRFIRYGKATWPLNLWMISDADRQAKAFQLP